MNTPSQKQDQLVPTSLCHPLAVTALSILRQLPPISPNLSSQAHGFTFSLIPSSHGGREKPGKAGAETYIWQRGRTAKLSCRRENQLVSSLTRTVQPGAKALHGSRGTKG